MKPLYQFLKTCMRYVDKGVVLDNTFIKEGINEQRQIDIVSYVQTILPTLHNQLLENNITNRGIVTSINNALNHILLDRNIMNTPMQSDNALIWIINAGVFYYSDKAIDTEI